MTNLTAARKEWLDNATYEQLLERIRFAPVGDPMFQPGEWHDYFKARWKKVEGETGIGERIRASKNIGWTQRGRKKR